VIKTRNCKACKVKFEPRHNDHIVCSFDCAIANMEKTKAKKAAKQQRQDKQRIKTKAQYTKEAQIECNKFIRVRDAKDSCISCGRYHNGQYHAGHYRSIGAAPELRFNEYNIHKQCSACNNHKSGNILEYRINLIKKIGLDKVEWLEGKHEAKHYTIEDIKAIKLLYRDKAKQLVS